MKQTDTRPLFATPWAQQADNATIATIPQTATAIGRASMEMGFPKATMTPIAAGGVPPYGEDMNGILNMLSRAAQAAELGIIRPFSADYAASINGYPTGATIAHPTTPGRFLICTADNNTNDPTQSMNGWLDPLGGLQPSGDYATNTSLRQETERAQAAEAGLLPLAGGTVTGTINRSGGGVLPEVLGTSGRVVIQAFTLSFQPIPRTGSQVPVYSIRWPQPFRSTPQVFFQIDWENGTSMPSPRTVNIAAGNGTTNNNVDIYGARINITYTGWSNSVVDTTNAPISSLNVIAIGEM